MSKAKGYSVWLIPPDKIYNELKKIIFKLAGQYNSPVFEPHITLISGIEGDEEKIIFQFEKLAKKLKPIKVTLTKVKHSKEYFKCIFLTADKDKELNEMNLTAKTFYKKRSKKKFQPHLSLLYGKFSEQKKKEIISEIGENIELSFTAEKISIYSTQGKVEEWYKVR